MWVDSHCHLDLEQFDGDRAASLERASAAGVGLIVNPGIDLQHSQQAIDLATAQPMVYAAVGIHPNSSGEFTDDTLAQLRQLAAHPKVVAIGEIGLDYYWDKVSPPQQAMAFRAQLALAAELGLPVIIHDRDAHADVTAILREWVKTPLAEGGLSGSPLAERPFAGVLHAFSGDLAMAQEAYDWNFVLSLGGPVTFQNARRLHELVPQLRLDRLMLETDAPYLTPHPYRGTRNEPAYVALVGEQMGRLYGVDAATIAQITTQTAQHFFGLDNYSGFEATRPNGAALFA